MTSTHANCTHPKTKAARAACRREVAKTVTSVVAESQDALDRVLNESVAAALPADPFDLFPTPEDDWADPDQFFGTGDDSGSADADLLD